MGDTGGDNIVDAIGKRTVAGFAGGEIYFIHCQCRKIGGYIF